MRQCTIIYNPTSGSYSPAIIRRIEEGLRRENLAVTTQPTCGPGDAVRLARAACAAENPPLLIAAGGDGTVSDVVNGLPPGKGTIAVVPMGTSNVLAKELGIRSVDDAIARIVRGTTRSCSVGLVKMRGERRAFTLMAGIGFDGAVVETVRLAEKRLFHQGAYILAALRLFARWDGAMLRVSNGEREVICHSVVACNASRYGGSFVLAPRADVFSPSLEVVCFTENSRVGYLKTALSLVSGRGLATGMTFSARSLLISGEKGVQTDGDYLCRTPVEIESIPDFASLII